MASEYLCPKDHSFYCNGKGCVLNKAACDSSDTTSSKPGYKTLTKEVLHMNINENINAQYLFNKLSNITAWSKDGTAKMDVVRFCAKMDEQCLWVKIVKYSRAADSAYVCSKKEDVFFKKGLSAFTPHIVQCAATKIEIADYIDNEILAQINALSGETVVGVFYMQPDKWVYLESFMNGKQFIVTQEMVVSILFQLVYTIACLQSQQVIHGNLNKPKTIALDLSPKEKTITYFRNNARYVVPINVKVIILNWEDVSEGNHNSDIKNVCKLFKELLSTLNHPDLNKLLTFLDAGMTKCADNLLENDLFKRYISK